MASRKHFGKERLTVFLIASYFFLPAACLAAIACCFFLAALLAFDCFCEDFFWLDFGDLSPITLFFYRGLTLLRHVSFSEGNYTVDGGVVIVNTLTRFCFPLVAAPFSATLRIRLKTAIESRKG
jgi:hypothetical protein